MRGTPAPPPGSQGPGLQARGVVGSRTGRRAGAGDASALSKPPNIGRLRPRSHRAAAPITSVCHADWAHFPPGLDAITLERPHDRWRRHATLTGSGPNTGTDKGDSDASQSGEPFLAFQPLTSRPVSGSSPPVLGVGRRT